MIGKPTSQSTRILIGISSFFVLIGLYSLISYRAYQKNPNQKTVPGWASGDRSFVSGFKKIALPLPSLMRGKTEDGHSFFEFDTRKAGWIYQDAIWDGSVGLTFTGGMTGVQLNSTGAASSLTRFTMGIFFGGFLAFVIGISMGCFSWIEAFFKPPISFLASIPPTAMVVVYMLVFGLEMKMFVAVVGMGIFPTLAQSIYQAVKNDVPESAVYKAYTLGASPLEVIWEVVIPQILPRIIDSIRLQVGPAMIFLIAVELGLGSEGIGYRLRNAPRGNYYNVIFIYLILLGIFGMVVDWALERHPTLALSLVWGSIEMIAAKKSDPQKQPDIPALSVNAVHHWFGDNRVLGDVKFQVAAGQIVAIVGPSGCGKSTLLRTILGTHPPRKGTILADGKSIHAPSRDVGIVYQHYSLFEFMTARENVAFGLKLDETTIPFRTFNYFGWRKLRKQHLRTADELLEKVQLSHAANLYPSEMSGGMRQRVAIAQAIVMKPKILLLDEPFGALDEATREELQLMLLRLYEENLSAKKLGKKAPYTIMMVTHELNEAIYVSDRILGLSQYHPDGEYGARIVYDRAAPVFGASDERDFVNFEAQKDEIRRVVFDAETVENHEAYVTFWRDHAKDGS